MQLFFKLLPWILLSSIVSVFGLAGNTNTLDDYLPKNISVNDFFSPNSTHDEISHSNNITKTIQPNIHKATNYAPKKSSSNTYPLVKQSPIYNSFDKVWFSPNPIETKENFTSNNPFSTITLSGIDGTGGPQPTPPTGIDGTGGPQPTPPTGIDGTGGPQPAPPTGIDGTGGPSPLITAKTTASGRLQEIDNCFIVNGITFCPNSTTQTTIDGNKNSDASILKNGQIAIIKGQVDNSNNGIAKEIIYTTQVSGAITQISKLSITVLKQIIVLDDDVIFGNSISQLSDLQIGDIINVSGFILSNGDLSATRIDKVNSSIDKLTGVISQISELDKIFFINQLAVDYSQVTRLPELIDGMSVNIKGEINNQDKPIFIAETIKITESIFDDAPPQIDIEKADFEPEQSVELEGFITELTDIFDFKVGTTAVSTSFNTIVIGGKLDDLKLNHKIEIEGVLDKNSNTLVAEKIIFLVANITSHKHGDTISDSTETFRWNHVDAEAYRLRILYYLNGNGVFHDEIFTGDTTSATIEGLPKNSAYFDVQLYTKQSGFWSRKLYKFFGQGTIPNSELTSHILKDGEKRINLESNNETFTWSHVPGAEAYRLRIYDYASQTTYYDNTFAEPEAVTVNNLPINGAEIYISIFTLHEKWWAEPLHPHRLASVKLIENSVLTSHINGQTLNSSTETFTWEDSGADKYELKLLSRGIGNSFSLNKRIVFDGATTSTTIDNLPTNGGKVTVKLRTGHRIVETGLIGWSIAEEYTLSGASIKTNAELTKPLNKTTLSSSSETFSWSRADQADEYHLRIYNPVVDGEPRFTQRYDPLTTSQEINDLPKNGAVMQVILSTRHDIHWTHNYYRIEGTSELKNARLTSHNDFYTDFKTIKTSTITLTWDDVDADGYYLNIEDGSTSPRTRLHKKIYGPETTSVVLDNLPKNANVRITLSTKHGRWWASKTIGVRTDIP